MLVSASGEDEVGWHIDKVKLVEPSVVACNAAAAVDAASSSNWQGRAAAGHTEAFADTEMKMGPSSLLYCSVPMDDGSQMWAVRSS